MTPEISPDVVRQVADARAAALEEAKEVIRVLQRAMPPLAKCSWNGACESALVALDALPGQPAPALRTPVAQVYECRSCGLAWYDGIQKDCGHAKNEAAYHRPPICFPQAIRQEAK